MFVALHRQFARTFITSAAHTPYKYGSPVGQYEKGKTPSPPKGHEGTFYPSFDNKLFMFTRKWEPEGQPRATLTILHGTLDHSGSYSELATHLQKCGIAVFGSDMRGWGLSDGEPLNFCDLDTFVKDIKHDYDRIHSDPKYVNVKPRFILGKSFGGVLAAHTVIRHPEAYSGLIGLSGTFDLKNAFPPHWALQLLGGLSQVLPKLHVKQPFDPSAAIVDESALAEWESDPLVPHGLATVKHITTLARAVDDLQPLLPRLELPLLMMWGSEDTVVSLQGHQVVLDRSRSRDRTCKVYKGAHHSLLAEPAHREHAFADIAAWIARRAPPPGQAAAAAAAAAM